LREERLVDVLGRVARSAANDVLAVIFPPFEDSARREAEPLPDLGRDGDLALSRQFGMCFGHASNAITLPR
jgi:hypothetical protein